MLPGVRDPRVHVRQRRRGAALRGGDSRPVDRGARARVPPLGLHVVCGLLERDGDALRNAAVLVGPDGLIGTYRKTHLPFLGVDRFVTPGDELSVYETPLGRIGVEICYDLRFPGGDADACPQGRRHRRASDELPGGGQDPDRADHGRARGGEPHLPADREPRRQGALGRVLRLEPDRRPVRERAWPRPERRRRRCSSRRSTSRRRATRTT